jgi:hypothetical protein
MKLCPNCSNLNSPNASRCECGFIFPSPPNVPPTVGRRVDRMLLGTLASVAFGLLAPQLVLAFWAALTGRLHNPSELLGIPLFTLTALIYVMPVWVVCLIPLYFLVPRDSVLWRWPVCTALGALAGTGLAALLLPTFFAAPGAIVGAATCFFGSITRNYFQRLNDHTRNA